MNNYRNGHAEDCECTAWECQVYALRAEYRELKEDFKLAVELLGEITSCASEVQVADNNKPEFIASMAKTIAKARDTLVTLRRVAGLRAKTVTKSQMIQEALDRLGPTDEAERLNLNEQLELNGVWRERVQWLLTRIQGFEGLLQKVGDCLTSGTGVVSSQAYATRALGAVQVLKENGVVLEHAPPVYNPFERLDERVKELEAELEKANAENRMFATNTHTMYETKERVVSKPEVSIEQLASELEDQWLNGNRGHVITTITRMPTVQAACVVGHIVWSLGLPKRREDFLTLLERSMS